MKRKIYGYGLVSVSLGLLFVFPGHSASAAEPVKIACHAEFTGKLSTYGRAFLYATRYEAKKKNESGGIKSLGGAKVEVVEEDNSSEPKNAVSSAERLASNKEILAIVGPSNTPLVLPVEPIAGKYHIPMLFANTADAIFEHGNKYVFTVAVLARRIGEAYAQFAMEMLKRRGGSSNRISICFADSEYGLEVASGIKETLKKAGFEKNIVFNEPFDSNLKDLTSVALKIRGANPDFHIQVGYFPDGKLFHEACFNLAFHPLQVGGMSGYNHPDMWKALGEKIGEDTLGNKNTFAGDYFTIDLPNPGRDAWIKGFLAENPNFPLEYTLISAAMGAHLVLDALEMAGKRDREAITDALHSLYFQKDDPRDFMGFIEKPGLVWASNGKTNSVMSIQQWRKKDGKWGKVTVYNRMMGLVNMP